MERKGGTKKNLLKITPKMAAKAMVGLHASQEPGASSVSPMWLPKPKALRHPPLPSQTVSSEMDETWSSQDMGS